MQMTRDLFFYWHHICARFRAMIFRILTNIRFKSVGSNLKIFGAKFMYIAPGLSVGDNCWLEAVGQYKGDRFTPIINIGRDVALSDFVHISCVERIDIGEGTLIGSSVYIGDHSHGSTMLSANDTHVPPSYRQLADAANIYIGKNVWIGDGVRILAGACIPDGSIVGANAVVKNVFAESGLIAGIPATTKRIFR